VGKAGLTPAYWEGSVGATGRQGGTPRAGVGYLEMTGYDKAIALGPR
jgi:predicted secreted hydrolase